MIPFALVALDTISAANTVTDTLELTDNAEYALRSYAPAIAPRSPSRLAGQARYAEVQDSIALDVLGSTAASCAQAHERLNTYLQQAARWWSGESVDAVRLRMREQSLSKSTTNDLIAVIYGAPDGTPPAQVNPVFDSDLSRWVIRGVQITFTRRGLLYGLTAQTATSSATNLKEIGSCTFASSSPLPVPTAIQVTPNGSVGAGPGYLVVAAAGGIRRLDAASGSVSSGTAVATADSANRAVGGSVMRFTAPGAVVNVPLGLDVTWRQVALFATVRVNTVGGEWTITARLGSTGAGSSQDGQPRIITAQPASNPQSIFLGLYSARLDFRNDLIITAVGNTGTMDINCLYIVRTDLPAAIIDARANASLGFFRDIATAGIVQPRDHYDREPLVGGLDIAGAVVQRTYSYEGDPFVTTEGTGLSFVLLDGGAGGTWREGSGTTPRTDVVTASRYPGYLTPQ